jgi:hypothetical protein
MKKYEPVSLKSVRTYPLKKRKSRVSVDFFARMPVKGDTLRGFLNRLPGIFAAEDFKSVVRAVISARKKQRPVVLGMGAHPIKLGLSPVIIELMKRKIITALATNGASSVHDFEVALIGQTSEDVSGEICSGSFGMARETGRKVNLAINKGVKKGYGIGKALGEYIHQGSFKYREKSIFSSAHELNVPLTVHVALGTDIIHMHPEVDGAALGEGSMRDFRLLVSVISDLRGGVYINLGSAVILPEVFLKALNTARNLGNKVDGITTVNMDFIQHYRPRENVMKRPTIKSGKYYALTGHHEIMFPLLASAIIEELE